MFQRWWDSLMDRLARALRRPGEWRFDGASSSTWEVEAREVISRVARLTGDRRGLLRAGGTVIVRDELEGVAYHTPGRRLAGAAEAGRIWVLSNRPVRRTALAHEAAHLALTRWSGGPFGGVRLPTEAECDRVARDVMMEAP